MGFDHPWGKDKRPFHGGEYPYETVVTVYLPEGIGPSAVDGTALESRGMALLGQLEVNRRLAGLPSMATHYTEADGTYYEYGSIMGRPFVRVWPAGLALVLSAISTRGIAYLFPPATGNTIHYVDTAWSYVKNPDNRAVANEKFYGRIFGAVADATSYDTRTLHYKGYAFLLGNNTTYAAAAVYGDPTGQDAVTAQTAGVVIAFRDIGNDMQVWTGNLPAIASWKEFTTYNATTYPEIQMTFEGTISAYSIINFCYDQPYVCTFRNNAGVSTLETFHLTDLSLVDSVPAALSTSVDLRPSVTATITTGPAFSRPYSLFNLTVADFDTGAAIAGGDYLVAQNDSDGVTAHWTVSFSDSHDIADFATDCHKYASALSTDLPQVSGTVTRSCTADTLFKVAEYATSYDRIGREDFYSPDLPPSETLSHDSATYTKLTEESSFSATYAFTGTICGLPYTLDGSETLTRSRQIEEALYQTSVTDNGAGGVTVVWRGGLPPSAPPGSFLGDADNTKNKSYTRSMQSARCMFSDRRFGAVVVVEATSTIEVVYTGAVLRVQTGDNFSAVNDGEVFHAATTADYITNWADNLEPDISDADSYYTSITQTVDSQTTQDLVLYYGDVEVYRTQFYNKVFSGIAVDDTQSVDLIESIAIDQGATASYCSLPSFGPVVSTAQCTACADETGMIVRFTYTDENNTAQQIFVDTHGDNWKAEAGDATSVTATAAAKMFRV